MNIKTKTIKTLFAAVAAVMFLVFSVTALAACTGKPSDGKTDDNTAVEYTVTFDSHGGTSVAPQKVKDGGLVVKPADPTQNGYKFDGWYTAPNNGKAWNFAKDKVTGVMTLHAKWTEKQTDPDNPENPDPPYQPEQPSTGDVTVTFNVGLDARKAGISNPMPVTLESGGKVQEPTVAWTGAAVRGWYREGGAQKWNFAQDVVTNDMTLFAKWGDDSSESVEYSPSADINSADHVYIHYYRPGGDYDGFTAYCWKDGGLSNSFDINKIDASGAVFEVSLNDLAINTAIDTVFKFIITRPNWDKDGGDNVVAFSSMTQTNPTTYHWYVEQGKTNSGKNEFTISSGSVGGEIMYTTEQKRASAHNVDRAFAQSLSVMDTATNTDDMGVGYQIFVASFCDGDGDGMGDIRGIIKRLDYLDSLNVDVLWLTPVQTSDSYHGYDCYDYYSIDPKFGTDADYRELVYKAHERGMKVIMDLVVNHTSPKNEWFVKSKAGAVETVTYTDGTQKEIRYRDFYRWKDSTGGSKRYYSAGDGWYYYSSFGSGMPELNYDCQEARDAMADVAMYWMAYGLDGFRMDAIKHMFMWDESDHDGDVEGRPEEAASGYNFNLTKDVEWFKEFNYRLKSKYSDCFLLGENLTGDVRYVAPFYAGMDSLFDFNTYYDMAGNIQAGNASKAAAALGGNAAQYEAAREGAGRAINSMITSNHDIPRLAYQCGGNVDRQKLYIAVTMTSPGLSWIYYGDEIGMGGGSGDDRKSRQPMKWTNDWEDKALPSAVPNNHYDDALASVAEQSGDDNSLLSYVRALTALRDAYPVLIHGAATYAEENGMLKITVADGKKTAVVYHNFSSVEKTAVASGEAVFGSERVKAYGTAVFVA